MAAPTADGRVRHRVGLDEALVPRASLAPGPQPGKVMEVVGGRHEGLRCAVKELLGGSGGCGGMGVKFGCGVQRGGGKVG